ncbi:TonB-dependent receptor plug domain-containing protein [Nitrospinaceae bacterium]|nr:TonB-dependent receptor plug domain-containing protein [Nitrospinaceae bacterium]
MYKIILTIVISFSILIANTVLADPTEGQDVNKIFLEPIKVKATKIETTDAKATYASEVYTYDDIVKSGATTIYDFLAQNTSIVVVPNSGDILNQVLDMRGFGAQNGYQSLVISVDGRRLNNIDGNPQNLSTIPIRNIERIEINKGSGSVVYGDGAMSGTIQIYTRNSTQTNITGSAGNYGITSQTINTGASFDKFEISAFADNYNQAGTSDKDPSGKRNEGHRYSYKVKVKYEPTKSSEFFIEKESSGSQIRYQNSMALGVFDQNPASNLNSSNTPTNYQDTLTRSDRVNLGGKLKLGENVETSLDYFHQDRESIIFDASGTVRYTTDILDGNITLTRGPVKFITGFQNWRGNRHQIVGFSAGQANKTNNAIYGQAYYEFDTATISLGTRQEWSNYTFNGSPENYNLQSYDIGINKSINEKLSVFSNYNYAFQTINIDALFGSDGTFNGFIDPTKSKTLNIGLNHRTSNNKLAITVYGSKLENELFLQPVSPFRNTNLDKTTKYGLEIQNKHSFNQSISAFINYNYTKAIIDEEDLSRCNDKCEGNDLPGVSAHNVTFGLHYNPTQQSKVIITQRYRSESFAFEDFGNNFNQKQKAYYTTNLAFHYNYKSVQLIAKVDNLFERSHGSWLRDNVVTPFNYTRNWSLGANIAF